MSGMGTAAQPIWFRFPLAGSASSDSYFDHDPEPGKKNIRSWDCWKSHTYDNHRGTDYGRKIGTTIYAAAGGTIVDWASNWEDDGCGCVEVDCPQCTHENGNFVKIDHGEGVASWYLHLKKGSVAKAGVFRGKRVECGDTIGETGNSGKSLEPHLHFGVHVNNQPIDPYRGECSQPQSYWVGQDGAVLTGSCDPTASSLKQFRANGLTSIPPGGTTGDSQVVFKAYLGAETRRRLRLQVELQKTNVAFTGTHSHESGWFDTGEVATVELHQSLAYGNYHWRARIVTDGFVGAWASFGGNQDGATDVSIIPICQPPTTVQAIVSNCEEPDPPTLTTKGTSKVTATTADLGGTVIVGTSALEVWFDYGQSVGYGYSTPHASIPANAGTRDIKTTLTGLTCNTTYHYRLAGSGGGAWAGADATFTTMPCESCSVRVLSPNGGEMFQLQRSYTIRWSASGSGCGNAQELSLIRPDGSLREIAAAASGGTYLWTVPSDISYGDGYRLLAFDEKSLAGDRSDDPFSIQTSQISCAVQVITPNGNEMLQRGRPYDIRWSASGAGCGTQTLQLLRGDSSTTTIAAGAPAGQYSWTVPNEPAASDYRIRVTDDTTGVADVSDEAFSIASSPPAGCSITVIWPNGGENLEQGKEYDLEWSATGLSCDNAHPVVLRQDGRSSVWELADSSSGGRYRWTVPQGIGPGTGFRLRIYDEVAGVADESDEGFSIVSGPECVLDVIAPNGGETFHHGENVDLRWSASEGCSAAQFLEIRYDGQVGGWPVAGSASGGHYAWEIPTYFSARSDYRLRVVDDATATVDESDGGFSIGSPGCSLNLMLPNGGETYQHGQDLEIRWSASAGCGALQSLELWQEGRSTGWMIEASASGGHYAWGIPSDVGSGSGYRVRVKDAATLTEDASDAGFSISPASVSCDVRIHYPNGGERLEIGQEIAIKWSVAGNTCGTMQEVVLQQPDGQNGWLLDTKGGGELSWTVPEWVPLGNGYRFRIYDPQSGASDESDDVVSVDMAPPGTPDGPTPPHGATNVSAPVTLSWSATRAATYEVAFGVVNPPPVEGSTTDANFSVTVAPGKTYYWSIAAENSGGRTAGPVWSFSTAGEGAPCVAPAAPGVTAPERAVAGKEYYIQWPAVPNATRYTVDEALDPNFQNAAAKEGTATIHAFTHDVTRKSTYYYRVRGVNKSATCDLAGPYSETATVAVEPGAASAKFTVTVSSTKGGRVELSPSRASYSRGAIVELHAIAEEGYYFAKWSGDAAGIANPLRLTVADNMDIEAMFGRPKTRASRARSPEQFVQVAPMNTPRVHHTATLLGDGRVLIAGGDTSDSKARWAIETSEIFDPRTGRFIATGSMSTRRSMHTAARLQDGSVLIAGGNTASSLSSTECEIYNPRTGEFRATGSMVKGRRGHSMTTLGDGRVLIIGGESWDGTTTVPESTAELYEPAAGVFTLVGQMAFNGWYHTATLLPNGKVLIVGASIDTNRGGAPTVEIFDPSTKRSSPVSYTTDIRAAWAKCVLRSGKVLLLAEGDARTSLLYDSSSNVFATAARPLVIRGGPHVAVLDSGRVLVLGGIWNARSVTSAEIFDPEKDAFRMVAQPQSAHSGGTATTLRDGRVLLAGGYVDPKFSEIAGAAEIFDEGIRDGSGAGHPP
jgi:hypothetical protein